MWNRGNRSCFGVDVAAVGSLLALDALPADGLNVRFVGVATQELRLVAVSHHSRELNESLVLVGHQ